MHFQHNGIEVHHHRDLQDGIVKKTLRLLLFHLKNKNNKKNSSSNSSNNNDHSLPYDPPEGMVHSMGGKELSKSSKAMFLAHPQDCKLCQFPKH
jgi:hypothetical protein